MRNRFVDLRREISRLPRCATITGAVLLGVAWWIVLSLVGSPRFLLRLLSSGFPVVPAWLLLTVLNLFFLLAGGCLGALLGCAGEAEGPRYRRAFFLSASAVFSYLWYALLFGARFLLPAVLLAAFTVFCLVAALSGRRGRCRVVELASGIMLVVAAYLLFLSVVAFFLV